MNQQSEHVSLLEAVGNRLMHYSPEFTQFLVNVLPETEVRVLKVVSDGQLAGILIAAIIRNPFFGTVVNSLPFFGSHGGPIAADASSSTALVRSFSALVEEVDAVAVTLVEDPFHSLDDALIAESGLEVVDDRIGQFTTLPGINTEIALFERFHVKTRNAVRKGQRLVQRIEQREDAAAWNWMQSVHERSILALGGVPKPMKVFDAARKAFGNDARLYVGSVAGRMVSGVVVILYRGTVEYFTPVVEETERDTQALSATIFAVMCELAAAGYTLWNWGGTWRSQEGVYRFKSRWGAEDWPYRYLNRVLDPAIRHHSRDELSQAFPNFYLFRY